jgi:hypothetical protein
LDLSLDVPLINVTSIEFSYFQCWPILLQKSPQTFCEIRIGNNRIDAGEYLNQCCASVPHLESILRGRMGKIFLQQYRPICDMPGCPLHVCYVGQSGRSSDRHKSTLLTQPVIGRIDIRR